MTILNEINRYKELTNRNKVNKGLLPNEFKELNRAKAYIKENIIDAINNGYTLVLDSIEPEIKSNKPSKKQFREYLVIQKSGITNMYDANFICGISKTNLTKEKIFYIMDDNNYQNLIDEYNLSIDDITNDELEEYSLA